MNVTDTNFNRLSDFLFDLPGDRIAQQAAEPRDAARLLVFDRRTGAREHRVFRDLPGFLRSGDLLVLNDTRVLPHRLVGRRQSGGRVECLILGRTGATGHGFLKPARRLMAGEELEMESGALRLRLAEDLGGGRFAFTLEARDGDVAAALQVFGRAPLPPYIERADADSSRAHDRERYQTVFAAREGAVAAPTAGLHFTPELLDRIRASGVDTATVTLHVGEGTFEPVRVEDLSQHRMHAEEFDLPPATAGAIASTRARGGRVVAVGTTAARVLETMADARGGVTPGRGSTALFLLPGTRLRVVDALVTNFHLPGSTLLMLVAALTGQKQLLELYREAIEQGYRFYSFGDAMLIT